MSAITGRQKLIGGVFCIVTAAWLTDMLTGQPAPSNADAAPSAQLVGPAPAVAAACPEDLAALIASLGNLRSTRAPLPFDQVSRDLFMPTASMEARLRPIEVAAVEDADGPEGPESLPFSARHRLQGILTGRVPLALIDGQLLRRGAIIDGHRLAEIGRDSVVLQGDGDRVVLRVAPVKE